MWQRDAAIVRQRTLRFRLYGNSPSEQHLTHKSLLCLLLINLSILYYILTFLVVSKLLKILLVI